MVNDFIDHVITVFGGFFAIMNPNANTAFFAGLSVVTGFMGLIVAVIVIQMLLGRCFWFCTFNISS